MSDPVETPGQPPRSIGVAAQASELRERQAKMWTGIKAMNEPPLPLVISSTERLTHLIEKAEPILKAGLQAEKHFKVK